MRHDDERTARIEVVLPGIGNLESLSRESHVAVTVLRARVSAGRSWYRLELRGSRSRVAQAVDRIRDSCP
jgi:hypothetical protein